MPTGSSSRPHRSFTVIAALLTALVGVGVGATSLQNRRDVDVAARKYSFNVDGSSRAVIRVTQDDLVRITFHTDDIPHSFTIEESPYRIMRRAEQGKPVSFDFRADQAGRFRFFCSLTADPGCKDMQGTLIVDPK